MGTYVLCKTILLFQCFSTYIICVFRVSPHLVSKANSMFSKLPQEENVSQHASVGLLCNSRVI